VIRRRAFIALVVGMLALVAACGESGSPSAESPPPPAVEPPAAEEAAPPAEPAPAEPAPAESGTGETATTSTGEEDTTSESPSEAVPPGGTLAVALNLPSPGFQVGAVDGERRVTFAKWFEVELVRAIAQELGVRPQLVQVEPFRELLAPGDKPWDLAIAQVTITEQRERQVDFSETYLPADQGVLLRKGLPRPPESIADLRVLQLCTQDRTTASDLIRRRIMPTVPAQRFARLAVLFQELQVRACDAAILDAPILGAERAQLPFRYGPLAGQIPTGERYGIVLPEGSALREDVNAALGDLVADGTVEALSRKWLSTDLASLPVLGE
jgi:polar amino acid transport system substrate-binding protein